MNAGCDGLNFEVRSATTKEAKAIHAVLDIVAKERRRNVVATGLAARC